MQSNKDLTPLFMDNGFGPDFKRILCGDCTRQDVRDKIEDVSVDSLPVGKAAGFLNKIPGLKSAGSYLNGVFENAFEKVSSSVKRIFGFGNGGKIADDELVTVFRGVNPTHPGFANAQKGIAKPRSPISGHSSPELHNEGITQSKFVSATNNRNVAERFSGHNGVILEKRIPRSGLTTSPDKFKEAEVLIRGGFRGAKVTKP
ncbi:MAG: hypothetical protein G3M70_04835 [Candidatus Nitronauta litoralis]|uniref:Uncharacterized protein n=1 Tax=Candidatus Nitronauta litoralis TaxID=2705533 RepID=A0A7T0FZV4_9BACT|nr:MAG: hypothetical protein G3M70_04835 [Candidatus Nitronauta litoralis]